MARTNAYFQYFGVTNRPLISFWKYITKLPLLFLIYQSLSASNHGDQNSEILLLRKNRNTLENVSHNYLSDFKKRYRSYETEHENFMLHFDAENFDDYYLHDFAEIEDSDYLTKDKFFETPFMLTDAIFINIFTRIQIPYSSKSRNNGIACLVEDDSQNKKNTEVCLFIIESFYIWYNKKVTIDYYTKDEELRDESVLQNIQNKLKHALEVVFIFHPTIMEYIKTIEHLKNNLATSERFIKAQKRAQHSIVFEALGFAKLDYLDSYIADNVNTFSKTIDHNFVSFVKQYRDFHKSVINNSDVFFTSESESVNNKPSEYNIEIPKKFSEKFFKWNHNIACSPGHGSKEKMLEVTGCCISYLKSLFKIYNKDQEFKDWEEKIRNLKINILEEFYSLVETSYNEAQNHLLEIEWNPTLVTHSSMWETTKLIETKSTASEIISGYILGLTEHLNTYQDLNLTYSCAFPALIKSIGDTMRKSGEEETREIISLKKAIQQVFEPKWTIESYLNLYLAVTRKSVKEEDVLKHYNFLFDLLISLGITSYDDYIEIHSPNTIRIMYAIHILRYNKCFYKPRNEDFSTKFRAAMLFAVDLEDHIDDFKNNSK